MAKAPAKKPSADAAPDRRLLTDLRELIAGARAQVARSVNSSLVLLYWHVGRRIREDVLQKKRAEYGQQILPTLSAKLNAEFGPGRNERNLAYMVRFAEVFAEEKTLHILCAKLGWSHFRLLVGMDDKLKRDFYAETCRVEGWSVRGLERRMMLREGWDVRNVTVVLGLRPFTAKAEILPEQVIGRGLRLMTQVSPDRTQTLEVLGTRNLLDVLRTQLEAEGVGVASTKTDPPPPVIIAPIQERLAYDIAIPITKPSLEHDIRKLSELKVDAIEAIYDQAELAEPFRVKLRLEFATTETEVHQADIAAGELPPAHELLASITNKVIDRAKLPNRFAELYPIVRDYVASRCFGRAVNLDDDPLRSHLSRLELQEGIAKYLARKIAELTIERRAIEFDKADFRLSETKPFSWRRNLPPFEAKKTVFNYVATYNDFERRFAEFLDKKATDVLRFASLGTTEQGESGTQFRVDYLKPSGAIGFYHPDWVIVQKTKTGEVTWIIETKGRVWEGTAAKDEALKTWCDRVSAATGAAWRYARINQTEFESRAASALGDLVDGK